MFSSHPADADDDDADEGEGDDADDHDTGDCEREDTHSAVSKNAKRPGSDQFDSTSMFLSQFDFDENAYDADDQPARPSAQRLEQPVLSHFAESWPSVT